MTHLLQCRSANGRRGVILIHVTFYSFLRLISVVLSFLCPSDGSCLAGCVRLGEIAAFHLFSPCYHDIFALIAHVTKFCARYRQPRLLSPKLSSQSKNVDHLGVSHFPSPDHPDNTMDRHDNRKSLSGHLTVREPQPRPPQTEVLPPHSSRMSLLVSRLGL